MKIEIETLLSEVSGRLAAGTLPHAMILEGAGAEDAAVRISAACVCTSSLLDKPCTRCAACKKAFARIHPDVHIAQGSGSARSFHVDEIRFIREDAYVRPNEAARKVYLFLHAEDMTESAQNALLKLLEEPPAGACFILCADNAAALLDTVRSRCVEKTLHAETATSEDAEADEQIGAYLRIAAERDLPALLRLTADWEKLDTDALRDRIHALYAHLAEALCLRAEAPGLDREQLGRLLALAERAESFLRANVGGKHVLGLLAAETIDVRSIKSEE